MNPPSKSQSRNLPGPSSGGLGQADVVDVDAAFAAGHGILELSGTDAHILDFRQIHIGKTAQRDSPLDPLGNTRYVGVSRIEILLPIVLLPKRPSDDTL